MAAAFTLGIVPTVAYAAPANDNYLASVQINQHGTPLQTSQYQAPSVNTATATEQTDLFSPSKTGGGQEVTRCDFANGRKAYYGKTVWYDFHPHVPGQVLIQAAGFDAVIGLVPYNWDTALPFRNEWVCSDDPDQGATETAVFNVEKGRSYSIQIGGWAGDEPDVDNPSDADSGNLVFRFNFFPDSDGDKKLDQDDQCPTTPGLPNFGGCPDADGDGVPEPTDACPGVKGDLANGCKSRPDADHDGVFDDGPDKCLGQDSRARDANGNGCLDLATFSPTWIFRPGSYFRRSGGHVVLLGIGLKRFGVKGVPNGAKVTVTCTRRECSKMSKTAKRGRAVFSRLAGEKLRAGSKVTIRVTRPGFVGRARIYLIERNDYTTKNRCLLPGKTKPQTACSPLR